MTEMEKIFRMLLGFKEEDKFFLLPPVVANFGKLNYHADCRGDHPKEVDNPVRLGRHKYIGPRGDVICLYIGKCDHCGSRLIARTIQ